MNKQTISVVVIVVAVIVMVSLLFSTRERREPRPPDMGSVLAQVDDWTFDLDELDRRLETFPRFTQSLRHTDPDRFVQQVVDRHLMMREAERRGLAGSDFYHAMYEDHPDFPDSHEQAMIQALMRDEMAKLPPITESYMRERFEAQPEDFPGMLGFERNRDLIEGLIRHEREVLRALAFVDELREQAEIQINHRARAVLLGE